MRAPSARVKRLGREIENPKSSIDTVHSAATSVRDNPYGVVIKHQHAQPLPLQISVTYKGKTPITDLNRA